MWVVVQSRTVPGKPSANVRSRVVLPPLPITAVTPCGISNRTASSASNIAVPPFVFL